MPQSPTYQPDRMRCTHAYAYLPHLFYTHRTHVAFPINARSGRRWRRGGGFGGGSGGIAVTGGEGGGGEEWSLHAPVTATPVAIADTTPHAKSPLCRAR